MVLAADYPFLDVFWTMILFFFWIAWIWMLILIFSDVFRRDMSGWAKAGWCLFVLVLPFLGAFVYLIANGKDLTERRIHDAQASQAELRSAHPYGRRRLGGRDRARQAAARQRRHQPGRVRAAQGQSARLSDRGSNHSGLVSGQSLPGFTRLAAMIVRCAVSLSPAGVGTLPCTAFRAPAPSQPRACRRRPAMRSRMFAIPAPTCVLAGSNPAPESQTVKPSAPPVSERSTETGTGPACLAALSSAARHEKYTAISTSGLQRRTPLACTVTA